MWPAPWWLAGSSPSTQDSPSEAEAGELHNGLQAIMRAMEICHVRHADLRFGEADMVLRPQFRRTIETLEFGARRECVAAGIRSVRREKTALRALLCSANAAGEYLGKRLVERRNDA